MEWLIDADAHVTESADVWTARLPAKWADVAPRVVRDPDTQEDFWYVGGLKSRNSLGAGAMAGAEMTFPERPRNFDECPPGSWNAKERLRYMDSVGIWAQVIYPNVGGFGNESFLKMKDEELRLACVRAYNDWLTDWCSEDPRRLVAVASMPFWDVDECVKEVERCAAKGHRGILFTGEPERFTGKFVGEKHWDPLWHVASDTGMPISLHLGSGDMETYMATPRAQAHGLKSTGARAGVALFLDNAKQVTDFLLSGVLPKFPDLKIISVESGAGWVPFVLESVDRAFMEFAVGDDFPQYEALPSEYFRRNISVCYFFEAMPQALAEKIGVDNLLFETDYPHPICLYDDIRGVVERNHADQTPEVRRKLLFDNSARLYRIESPAPVVV